MSPLGCSGYDRMQGHLQAYFILVTLVLCEMRVTATNSASIKLNNITVVNRNMMTNRDHRVSHSYVSILVDRPLHLDCDTRAARGDRIKLVLWFKNSNLQPIYSLDMRSTSQSSGVHWQEVRVLQDRATFDMDKSPASLVITNSSEEDQGVYRCRVDFNTAPTRISEINVTVVVPPQKPVIRSSTTETGGKQSTYKDGDIVGPFREGDTLRLNCSSSGGVPPPALIWWGNTTLIDSSFERLSSNQVSNLLELRNLTRNHLNQKIKCAAVNFNNPNVAYTSKNPNPLYNPDNPDPLYTPDNPDHLYTPNNPNPFYTPDNPDTLYTPDNPNSVATSISIDMVLPPLNVNLLKDQHTLIAGRKHRFTCEASGARPAPIISWTIKTSSLKQSDIQESSADDKWTAGHFSLLPTRRDNGMNLSCHVRTPGLSQTIIRSRILDVKFAPEVELRFGRETDEFKVVERENVSLVCEVDANPRPQNIAWTRNSEVIQFGEGISAVGHHLLIEKVGRRFNGVYACSAINSLGRKVSNNLILDIKSRPFCNSSHAVHKLGLNESVEVTCPVQFNTRKVERIHWTFTNNKTKVKLKGNSRRPSAYVYTPRSLEDYGHLLCWGENELGKQQKPCVVQILPGGSADAVVPSCVKQNVTYSSFEIICDSSSHLHGTAEPIFAVVSNAVTGDVVWSSQSQSGQFVVSDLSPDNKYRVFLVTYNEEGLPHKVHMEVTTKANSTYPANSWSPGLALFFPLSVIAGIIFCGAAAICGITFLACRQNHKKNKKYTKQSDLAGKNLDLLSASQQQSLLHCSGPGDAPPSPSLPPPFPPLLTNPAHQFFSSSSLHRPPSYSTMNSRPGQATIRSCSSPPLSLPLLHVHATPMPSFPVPLHSTGGSMHGSQDVLSIPPYPRSDNDLNSEDNSSLSSYSTPVRKQPSQGPNRRALGTHKTFHPGRYHSGNLRNPSSGLRISRRVPRNTSEISYGRARGHNCQAKVGDYETYVPSVSDGGYSSNEGGYSSPQGGAQGTDRRYSGLDGGYSGNGRGISGTNGRFLGPAGRFLRANGGYSGTDRRFSGTDGGCSGTDGGCSGTDGGFSGTDGGYSGTEGCNSGTDEGNSTHIYKYYTKCDQNVDYEFTNMQQ